jgi:peptide/nickel transport system permease protein
VNLAVALSFSRVRGRLLAPGLAGAAVIGGVVLAALLAGVLAPFDPHGTVGSPLSVPSARHLLGTNDLGQDLFSVWLYGARVSLSLGFLAAMLSTGLAAAVGLASVLWRPARAPVLAVTDALLAIPHLPVVVLIVALLGPGYWHLVAALTLLGWPAYARVVRAQVQTTVQREYVEAARAVGASGARILRSCLLPDIASLLWTKFLLTVRWVIIMEATLALMGLGDTAEISWGTMLASAFTYPMLFVGRWWLWWALPPAISIALITLALAAIGQDFEMWLNPVTWSVSAASASTRIRQIRRAADGWATGERLSSN